MKYTCPKCKGSSEATKWNASTQQWFGSAAASIEEYAKHPVKALSQFVCPSCRRFVTFLNETIQEG